MTNKKKNYSEKEFVIDYLKKNKDFFIQFPFLINEINFPTQLEGFNRILDLNAYRSKKIKNDLGYEDTLNVVAMDEEISKWIFDGYR